MGGKGGDCVGDQSSEYLICYIMTDSLRGGVGRSVYGRVGHGSSPRRSPYSQKDNLCFLSFPSPARSDELPLGR